MKNQIKIILLFIVAVIAAALIVYFLLTQSQPTSPEVVQDLNYIKYEDRTNNAQFMHHKDWQVSSTYGFVRLTPKTGNGDIQSLQISFIPTAQRLQELKFGSGNDGVQVGNREMEAVHRDLPWKDNTGKELFTSSTSYLLLSLPNNRRVLFEVNPGVKNGVVPAELARVIETLELEIK